MFSAMTERLKQRQQGEQGFTLVELLVVIVILGVLASIVVFAVGGINNNSQSAACKADKAALSSAEEAYFAQNSNYATETQLKDGGYLHDESTLYNVTPNNSPTSGPKTYTFSVPSGSSCS